MRRPWLPLLGLLLAAAAAAGCTMAYRHVKRRIEEHVRLGRYHLDRERYREARQELAAALADDPDFAPARTLYEEAERRLREVVTPRFEEAQELAARGDEAGALRLANWVLGQLPEHFGAAALALSLRRRPAVREKIRQDLAQARELAAGGDEAQACRLLQGIFALEPENAGARELARELRPALEARARSQREEAAALAGRGDWRAAADFYRIALEFNPEDERARAGLEEAERRLRAAELVQEGRGELAQGRVLEAYAAAREALLSSPGDQAAEGLLAEARTEAGRRRDELVARAVRLYEEQQLSAALRDFALLVDLFPGDAALQDYCQQARRKLEALRQL